MITHNNFCKCNNSYRSYPPKEPVFIVSTGRSGTTTLTQILQIHPELCCLNEARPSIRTESFMKWLGSYPESYIKKRVKHKREKLISQITENRLVYIEGSPPASHLIGVLHLLFKFRFIHLFCDGREFIRRAADRRWHEKPSLTQWIWTAIRRNFLLSIVGARKVDRRLIPPSKHKTKIEKLAWLWVEVNESILRQMAELPDSHKFSLKLEELDEKKLIELHDFIGVKIYPDIFSEMLDLLKKKQIFAGEPVFPSYSEWSEDEKKRFDEIAGDMMRRLGYY